LSWGEQPPSSVAAIPVGSSFTTSATLAQVLTLEGDSAGVYAWAHYSDGTSAKVPATDLLVTPLTTSLAPTAGNGNQPWKIEVAKGALWGCGELVRTQWKVCQAVVAQDDALVFINLPKPSSMSATPLNARLTSPSNPATHAPVSVATSTRVTIIVEFDSGATADFSTDTRATITLDAASEACATVALNLVSIVSGATCSEITVLVAVPDYGMSQSFTLPVVYLQLLTVLATPYPTYSGSTSKVMDTLHKIDCTAHYQHATPAAYATLTDATQYTVTNSAVFASTSSSVISVSGTGTASRLRGTSIGFVNVTASWASATSAAYALEVTDNEVTISSLHFAYTDLSSFNTLTGFVGTTKVGRVQVIFDDGTQFTNFFTRVDWIPTPELLAFTSSAPNAASISTQGVLTLEENHYARIDAAVVSACSAEMTYVVDIAANLAADVGDVDLGNKVGVQFDQAGDTVEVPVRINAD
ncbi:hypothetical protein T492DRAFT_878665, partial [Pavlovales sp. CCMP2436]